jgi:hypothetical protein
MCHELRKAGTSGADLTFATRLARESLMRMSNPKLHSNHGFASGPLMLTFATVTAEK